MREKNIDINIQDKEGLSPVLLAVVLHKSSMVECFLNDQRTNLNLVDNTDGVNVLIAAVVSENYTKEMMRKIIFDSRTDIAATNNQRKDALMLGIELKQIDTIELLLSHPKIDLNYASNPAFNILTFAYTNNIHTDNHTLFIKLCTHEKISAQTLSDFLKSDISEDLQQQIKAQLSSQQFEALRTHEAPGEINRHHP